MKFAFEGSFDEWSAFTDSLCCRKESQATQLLFFKKGTTMPPITEITMRVGDPPVTINAVPADDNEIPREVDGAITYTVAGVGFDVFPSPDTRSFDVVANEPGGGTVKGDADPDLTPGVKNISSTLAVNILPALVPEATHINFELAHAAAPASKTARAASVRK